VVLAGGGSTGHVAPLLALADCLRRRTPAAVVTALGTAEGLEARLVPEAGYPLAVVPRVPLPRRPSADLGRLPFRLRAAVAAAAQAMQESRRRPSWASAATSRRRRTSRRAARAADHRARAERAAGPGEPLGARFTPYVAVTFPGTPLRGARVLGMPLRRQITTLDRAALRDEALARSG
jgi:UDP-N-acetylglucosamine--N-acetylmuramyl-(pentapeptide) pyrophosphoryl-undecaprenol N-acetylglucosamine transferase